MEEEGAEMRLKVLRRDIKIAMNKAELRRLREVVEDMSARITNGTGPKETNRPKHTGRFRTESRVAQALEHTTRPQGDNNEPERRPQES